MTGSGITLLEGGASTSVSEFVAKVRTTPAFVKLDRIVSFKKIILVFGGRLALFSPFLSGGFGLGLAFGAFATFFAIMPSLVGKDLMLVLVGLSFDGIYFAGFFVSKAFVSGIKRFVFFLIRDPVFLVIVHKAHFSDMINNGTIVIIGLFGLDLVFDASLLVCFAVSLPMDMRGLFGDLVLFLVRLDPANFGNPMDGTGNFFP